MDLAQVHQAVLAVHITTFKDFPQEETAAFQNAGFQDYFQFSTQPNMIFDIPTHWKTEQDYINALSKKYRDQFKRKRDTQKSAKERRRMIRELREDRDWN